MKLQEQDVFAGRYRLLRRIGSGGFSVVWLAADQMTNDREVALKIYVPDKGMDRQGIKMFVREYEIVADMNHPGLLKATHFDVHDGSPFLVMPFCSAGSLHSRMMERGSIPEGEIAEVLEQTAGALAYLHSKGVVHQDIKPDNILIDGDDNYLLTDFGISSRMRSTMRKSTGRKESMTVAYAPPERFSGSTQAVPASDVFSLGVVIFEMATGDLPWMGAGGAIVRPDSEPLNLPSGYSEGLEHLMRQCLQYDPGKRPTAEDVKAAASSYRSSGRWGTVSSRKRKGGGLWWLWVLVALVVLGGGYGVYTIMDNGSWAGAEAGAWTVAARSDSKASYEAYLEDYPDGSHAREAERKLAEIADESAWSTTKEENAQAGYEGYLEDYPDGAYARQARSKINDIEARRRAEAERRRDVDLVRVGNLVAAEEVASTMVEIAGGTFTMGCTSEQGDDCWYNERPAHEVYVSGFQLNKYEVTQAQWRAIMGSDPEELHNTGCAGCPVEGISWNDAQEFIRELNRISGLNYRLPTEAEWEYAARGGQQSRGYKYSGSDRIDAVAWYDDNSRAGNTHGSEGTTRPVGGKQANELGLYDMSGNVWEWCSDWWDNYYYTESPRNNPGGPSSGSLRVVRGGSWNHLSKHNRVAYRVNESPRIRDQFSGFRLAR